MKNISRKEVDHLRLNARSIVRELGLLNDAFFEIGVTLAERHLLIELMSSNCPTMGEVAEQLILEKSTASRLIAKAMKKGYVKCVSDMKDKRKRFLQLTELGKKTLQAFEPIAFSQTKDALLTLTEKEVECVYEGVALYAMGLRNARLQNKGSVRVKLPSLTPILAQEKELSLKGLTIRPFTQEDEKALYDIFQEGIDSGNQFHYDSQSILEFYRQFLQPQAHVFVCDSASQGVIGGFYIRPNFSGRASHIANAAYMVKGAHQAKGIGTLLIKASLEIAKELGFQAMQFNMVLQQNVKAITLYQKLGFEKIGAIPQAVRNRDGSTQDGYIFYRNIN